ncbi:hypothetical protein CA223_17880 [Sphingomonas koreensis]|uniref:Uncharacterized protein n=2 Tax=Sphingomonas koreensis TaxID=93064 RepID=A0A1L6J9S4_9SPHN|nr:hypothetical protein BRX40_09780 [Sphingomonas koreensis]RSU18342.1 hypothetical protein CA224_17070 [Sphingomonas koreensis]RSU28499.1 hypothetical protein CA222_05450 [Sphingomonas koreensis]RSU31180.1 hypothetical protein CA225_03530 [Sphingomonas koreensis]RSU35898.1 hypothetical protein CA223_17880 [Sphingomonas koreensis]
MSREQLDEIDLGFSNADAEELFARLGALLPEKKSWSASLRIWGDEKTDDIQVGFDGHTIEDIQVRLNVADLCLPLVGGICDLARHFDCILATRDGAIVQPNREAVVRTILQSRAMRFVRDPHRFLEEAIRLDREGA